jgi:hypothetical protein
MKTLRSRSTVHRYFADYGQDLSPLPSAALFEELLVK